MSLKILIVDDSATTRTFIKRTLALIGIQEDQLVEAGGGREALECLEAGGIDLVLSDLNMPGMDGGTLIREMEAAAHLAQIPVVIISTEGSRPRLERITRKSVVGFLRKPFTPEQLRDVLQSVLITS